MVKNKEDKSQIGKGGDGGTIFIFTNKIKGKGKIIADGGYGLIGGKGGRIQIVSNENKFHGEISTKGGNFLKNKQKI